MSAKVLTPEQAVAYKNLNIREGNRVLLCLDGGGIRGILSIQLLKKIEEIAGMPCHKFCDMVSGTSTGAIIAGLIASGKTAVEIEQAYEKFVTKVFLKRSMFANKFLNPPEYDKSNYREALKEELGDSTMLQACQVTGIDLLITAKDVTDNEETYFTCFNNNGWIGTYKDGLLRTILETTMSAPPYFSPLERFVDGGLTTYNNPSTASVIEALEYNGKGKYDMDKLTIFSLGTGKTVASVSPEDAADPPGGNTIFWLNYILATASQDASSMQSDFFRSQILQGVDYRRYQVSLDPHSINKLPNHDIKDLHVVNANWLGDLTVADLNGINLDDVSKFGLMKAIGTAMVEYIMRKNKFTADLNDTPSGRDELVTGFNSVAKIQQYVTSADWINSQPTK